jgi:hypothetical protein
LRRLFVDCDGVFIATEMSTVMTDELGRSLLHHWLAIVQTEQRRGRD